MRSGYVAINDGFSGSAGTYGYGWTSYADNYTNSTTANANHFAFEESGVRTGYKNNRWLAFSLRCLAD